MAEQVVDLAAASRISRRVELKEVQLAQLQATCKDAVTHRRALEAVFEQNCFPTDSDEGKIEVTCAFKFTVRSDEQDLAEASITYRLVYALSDDDATDEADLLHFARANGSYNSWPFVREMLHSLTSRMGFPPYVLPVLSFLPKPQPKPPASAAKNDPDNRTDPDGETDNEDV